MRISDWSSDVCSSDLQVRQRHLAGIAGAAEHGFAEEGGAQRHAIEAADQLVALPAFDRMGEAQLDEADRKSVVSGKSVSVRVDPGGLRITKNNIQEYITQLIGQISTLQQTGMY